MTKSPIIYESGELFVVYHIETALRRLTDKIMDASASMIQGGGDPKEMPLLELWARPKVYRLLLHLEKLTVTMWVKAINAEMVAVNSIVTSRFVEVERINALNGKEGEGS